MRELILDGKRPDGRGPKDLRSIKCEVGLLPRAHGSAIFQRGETQALVTTVLGTGADEQRVDGIMDEYSKKFMLDYNMPSFAVGEVRPIRGPGRREIGHGALAERSVAPMLPDPEEFPVHDPRGLRHSRIERLELDGLGLRRHARPDGRRRADQRSGGRHLDRPGEGDGQRRHMLLTDIIGDEDHFGDMDFKVAGTQRGVTGIQLDLKNHGITEEIIRETLEQAREARLEILRAMLRAIKRPREEISANAPRLIQIQINPEKIGLLIGPGGKTIRRLQEETGAKIDIDDSGVVTLSSLEAAGAEAARDKIEAMTEGVQVGRIYEGRVTSIKDFGAFVEILPGKDGLFHISELSEGYVTSVTDVCRVGDPMLVKVIAVDDQDRVKLSRKAAMAERGQVDEIASRPRPAAAGGGGGGDRGGDPAGGGLRPGVPAGPARRRPRSRRLWRRRPGRSTAAVTTDGPDRPSVSSRRRPWRGLVVRWASTGVASDSDGPPAMDGDRLMAKLHGYQHRFGSPVEVRHEPPLPAESPSVVGRGRSRGSTAGRAGSRPPTSAAEQEPEITRRLRAQYAEISQLAGGLAHEIRNPLSTLSLNLDLLAEDFQNPETPRDRRVLQRLERLSPRSTGCTTSSRASSGSPGSRS